jgi:hypothetical protein
MDMSTFYPKTLLLLAVLILTACSPAVMLSKSGLVDPHLSWEAPTTTCDEAPLMDTLTYNVYAVSGPGPVPTSPSADESPCGIRQIASGTPLNAVPVSIGTSFNAVVSNGVWTFAVEAVGSDGERSELSNNVTKVVKGRPGKPVNLIISLDESGLRITEETYEPIDFRAALSN